MIRSRATAMQALEELEREHRLRKGVYANWIRQGKISPAVAEERTEALLRAIEIVEQHIAETAPDPAQGSLI